MERIKLAPSAIATHIDDELHSGSAPDRSTSYGVGSGPSPSSRRAMTTAQTNATVRK
jgi:hypothetical protein